MSEILMPAFTAQMETATLARWVRRPGEPVVEGDVIAEVETEKATMEIEAPADGALARILVPQGARNVPVGAALAVFVAGAAAAAPESADEAPWTGPTAPTLFHDALRDALAEEMRRDRALIVLGEQARAGGRGGALRGLLAEFGPGRVIDAPPAAEATAGMAVGAALAGLRPLVQFASPADIGRAAAPIALAIAHDLPLTLCAPLGGEAGLAPAGFAPAGLAIVAPSGPAEARALLKAALRRQGPTLALEDPALSGRADPAPIAGDPPARIGRARCVREGDELTIACYGGGLSIVSQLLVEDEESARGAELVDLRSLAPYDLATLRARAARTRRLVLFDPQGGALCAEIAARVGAATFGQLDAPVLVATSAAQLLEAARAARPRRPA